MIRNFAEAREALLGFYNRTAWNAYKLDRMRALMEFLGNPQERLRIVHVAGTSGKTSTAYYASALLEASGANVGLTVSPHVVEMNERVQINRAPLPEREFCKSLGEFIDEVTTSGIEPSYFELMVAFAFQQFAAHGVDYAVVEVGLGGLLDGTNVISREDKVCIITDIGFDHTNVLGNTLAKIAAQKAGIIQPRNNVFMYAQGTEVMQVVRDVCEKQQANLHEIAPSIADAAAQLPHFQQRNFSLALATAIYILERDGVSALTRQQEKTAAAAHIPGRMEIFHVQGKTVVVDGAHNGQKMAALIDSMRAEFPSQPVAALVAFVAARDDRWQHALDALTDYADDIIITAFDQEPDDMPKKGMATAGVASYLAQQGKAYTTEPDLAAACQKLLDYPEPVLLVTGSLYMLGDVRRQLSA